MELETSNIVKSHVWEYHSNRRLIKNVWHTLGTLSDTLGTSARDTLRYVIGS